MLLTCEMGQTSVKSTDNRTPLDNTVRGRACAQDSGWWAGRSRYISDPALLTTPLSKARRSIGWSMHRARNPEIVGSNPTAVPASGTDMRYGRKGRAHARLTKEDKIDILVRRCARAERKLKLFKKVR